MNEEEKTNETFVRVEVAKDLVVFVEEAGKWSSIWEGEYKGKHICFFMEPHMDELLHIREKVIAKDRKMCRVFKEAHKLGCCEEIEIVIVCCHPVTGPYMKVSWD